MKILLNMVKRIFNFIYLIFIPVQNLFCRRLRSSDSLLPLVNNYGPPTETAALPVPSNEVELESWDTWESNGPSSLMEVSSNNHMNNNNTHQLYAKHLNAKSEETLEPEIDYFQDMQPHIKKTAKIAIRKKDNINESKNLLSSRLSLTTDIPLQSAELGLWDDQANPWAEASEDLTWEAEAAIKEKRRAEREERQLEQQRRKLEKECLRATTRKEHTLTAIRL